MPDNNKIVPHSLKDAPALIEVLFPAQKVSAEAYKEQMAGIGKTLTALGSYWKGRKPLILNKACILGALLPATSNLRRDLEIFEMLMGMDDLSFAVRAGRIKPRDIVAEAQIPDIYDYFEVVPADSLPKEAPFEVADYPSEVNGRQVMSTLAWKDDVPEKTRRRIEALALPSSNYRERVENAKRPETLGDDVHAHIWDEVNDHLGTSAKSMPELVEQLGVMRFGHRPRVADTFSGSGQIPFEAARLGCDVYASDLNPVACMLTWASFNIVGGEPKRRERLQSEYAAFTSRVARSIEELGIEPTVAGWQPKIYYYCVEARCPESGWMVPLLPSLHVNKVRRVVAKLQPNFSEKRYDIKIISGASDAELSEAATGTVVSEGRGQESYLVHTLQGKTYRTKISTLRGDYRGPDNTSKNQLRAWGKSDSFPHPSDIFSERLYAIQWMKPSASGRGEVYETRAVTAQDQVCEDRVRSYVRDQLATWQDKGYVPDTAIESGHNTDQPIWERGWTHWHHLFNPRQLLVNALIRKESGAFLLPGFARMLNCNSRLSRVTNGGSGASMVTGVFDNQALNTLYNYGCRASRYALDLLNPDYKSYPLSKAVSAVVSCHPAPALDRDNDIYVTDPPYGDAVKYEEILEFFIAWLRKNPPVEFADWVWDSRRDLAVKGEDHDFKLGMVAAYKRMAEKMPDNGIQVLMFTHQSGSIWADMANIVWASGLQVSAAWYVVTETDSALREGSYVKGTVLLVLRKRKGRLETFRDDLAIELRDEVEAQVKTLTGLNQETKDLYRDENLFTDSDLQMAGYAAALRVLTRYAIIDGTDMTVEALRPRVRGEQTRVDRLIEYAVEIANQCLVPSGISTEHWNKLQPAERFYLKMLDLESHKAHTLDNYQNFAKAFKVRDFHPLMASERANSARLKGSAELGRAEMSGDSEIANTPLRGVLYALMEFDKGAESDEVLTHLGDNVADYFQKRDTIVAIADFMASRLPTVREDEAGHARVLRDLVRNERLA